MAKAWRMSLVVMAGSPVVFSSPAAAAALSIAAQRFRLGSVRSAAVETQFTAPGISICRPRLAQRRPACRSPAGTMLPTLPGARRAAAFKLRDLPLHIRHDLVDREARRLLAGRIRDEGFEEFGGPEHALLGDEDVLGGQS